MGGNGTFKWIYPQVRKSIISPYNLGEPFVVNMSKIISKKEKQKITLPSLYLVVIFLKASHSGEGVKH